MGNEVILARISERLNSKGLSESKAALSAGLSKDAIRNWRRNPDLMPSLRTLSQLAAALDTTLEYLSGEAADHGGHGLGMRESDVTPLPPMAAEAAGEGGPNLHRWVIGPAFMGLSGYRAGDELVVESYATPKDGDDVLVQIEERGTAVTRLRCFRKNFVFAGADADPEWVDGERVRIAGVVRKMTRRFAGN